MVTCCVRLSCKFMTHSPQHRMPYAVAVKLTVCRSLTSGSASRVANSQKTDCALVGGRRVLRANFMERSSDSPRTLMIRPHRAPIWKRPCSTQSRRPALLCTASAIASELPKMSNVSSRLSETLHPFKSFANGNLCAGCLFAQDKVSVE